MDQKSNELISAGANEQKTAELRTSCAQKLPLEMLGVLDWYQVEQLQVLPMFERVNDRESEGSAGNEDGCYVNEDKTCVLLTGATGKQVQDIMMQCGASLRILDITGVISSDLHLSHLPNLSTLRLHDCKDLSALPGLCMLAQLSHLNLSGCSNLTMLPGLEMLTQLTSLNLSGCSGLTMLPGLEMLTQLTSLNLSGCRGLTMLPGLEMLTQLTALNLSQCSGLSSLPEGIRRMHKLRRLDLRGMLLRELPDWLPQIAEQFSMDVFPFRSGKERAIVYLRNTVVEDMDMSIFTQPYEVVVRWFEERARNSTVPLNEIKVVFLGDGEAGKSYLIARLMNDGGDPVDYVNLSTPGIAISSREFRFDGRQATVHFWDFGGQEILHSMHRMFLTQRTVYVVVVNARDDTQNERAKYWFQNINSFAAGAPMLLVLNKIDQNPNASVDERFLRKRYSGLRDVISMSALTFSREEFNRALTDRLLDTIRSTGYLDSVWPTPWMRVKQKLETMKDAYILGGEYHKICDENHVEKNRRELLHWFNDLGVSFCYSENRRLSDYVILRPEWITNAIYTLLFNPLRCNQNGIIPHEEIYRILTRARDDTSNIRSVYPHMRYSYQDVEYVLGVMRDFQLSFQLERDREMIPMLCSRNSSPAVFDYEDDPQTIEFRLEYDFLPVNVIHRFMVEMRQDLDRDHVWYTGARFISHSVGASAVVCSDGDCLRIIVRSEDDRRTAQRYLESIRNTIQAINYAMGLREEASQISYKADGKTEFFDYGILNMSLEAGETTVFSKSRKKAIPIQDILHQTDAGTRAEAEALLRSILSACVKMQEDAILWNAGEEARSRFLRNTLRSDGYLVYDQTMVGASAFHREYIAPDLEIRTSVNRPFAIFDAFSVGDVPSFRRYSERYVQKMLSYAWDQQILFLTSYVDCKKSDFNGMVRKCMDHLYNTYDAITPVDVNQLLPGSTYTAAARGTFKQKGSPVELYFLFVHIGS